MTKSEAITHISTLPDDAIISVGRDWSAEARQKVTTLKNDIDKAFNNASNPMIVDTMGSFEARALFYVKGVCERFVAKHKDLRMI